MKPLSFFICLYVQFTVVFSDYLSSHVLCGAVHTVSLFTVKTIFFFITRSYSKSWWRLCFCCLKAVTSFMHSENTQLVSPGICLLNEIVKYKLFSIPLLLEYKSEHGCANEKPDVQKVRVLHYVNLRVKHGIFCYSLFYTRRDGWGLYSGSFGYGSGNRC